jgi:LmbE family N-acetylglucosaminyl deacetylase
MRILAIGAHSDDMDEFCGGTLRLYVQQGHTVAIACMTDGRANGSVSPVEKLVATRKGEFESSANLIGASQTFWMGFADGRLERSLAARHTLEDIFRQFKPDVLITHPADDYHPDHTATHQLVMDASQETWIENSLYAAILFCESEGGNNFIPDEYVDITPVFDLKLKMMDVHRSQYDYGADPLTGKVENFLYDDVIALARFHGMQASVKYAEVFQICRKHGRLRAYRVLP